MTVGTVGRTGLLPGRLRRPRDPRARTRSVPTIASDSPSTARRTSGLRPPEPVRTAIPSGLAPGQAHPTWSGRHRSLPRHRVNTHNEQERQSTMKKQRRISAPCRLASRHRSPARRVQFRPAGQTTLSATTPSESLTSDSPSSPAPTDEQDRGADPDPRARGGVPALPKDSDFGTLRAGRYEAWRIGSPLHLRSRRAWRVACAGSGTYLNAPQRSRHPLRRLPAETPGRACRPPLPGPQPPARRAERA